MRTSIILVCLCALISVALSATTKGVQFLSKKAPAPALKSKKSIYPIAEQNVYAAGDYGDYGDYGGDIGAQYQFVDADSAASHDVADNGPGLLSGQGQGHTGFSVGGPLVSIAQGAADQANTAVVGQPAAAHQAAYMAKNQLAQSAAQSAATAAAALAGKQIILAGLEQQARDARLAVEGEKMQLTQAARAATAAQNSARQAMHQVQVITAGLNAAQATMEHANQAAAEAAAELAAQTAMVGQAKTRAQTIEEQLAAARIDFAATQAAANKATASAQLAQSNAAAAAASAAKAAQDTAPIIQALPEPKPTQKPLPLINHGSLVSTQYQTGPAGGPDEVDYSYDGYHY